MKKPIATPRQLLAALKALPPDALDKPLQVSSAGHWFPLDEVVVADTQVFLVIRRRGSGRGRGE